MSLVKWFVFGLVIDPGQVEVTRLNALVVSASEPVLYGWPRRGGWRFREK